MLEHCHTQAKRSHSIRRAISTKQGFKEGDDMQTKKPFFDLEEEEASKGRLEGAWGTF